VAVVVVVLPLYHVLWSSTQAVHTHHTYGHLMSKYFFIPQQNYNK